MHDHAHGVSGVRGQANHRLLAISLTLTSLVMVVQVVGAVLTGSLALLADAAHMFADASALVIALILGAGWIFRRLARLHGGLGAALGAAGKAPSGVLEVLGRYPVVRGQALVLIKLDRRVLLLSHASPRKGSAGGFSTLCEIENPADVAAILMKVNDAEGSALSSQFEQYLRYADEPGLANRASVPEEGPTDAAPSADLALPRPANHRSATTADGVPLDPAPTLSLRDRLASLRGRAAHDHGEAA